MYKMKMVMLILESASGRMKAIITYTVLGIVPDTENTQLAVCYPHHHHLIELETEVQRS